MLFQPFLLFRHAQRRQQEIGMRLANLPDDFRLVRFAEISVAHADDPEVIAQVARDRLSLVAPGEKVFYDIGN